MSKGIKKRPVRRNVWLSDSALCFALAALRDDRESCEQRGAVRDDWNAKYEAADRQIRDLIRAVRR